MFVSGLSVTVHRAVFGDALRAITALAGVDVVAQDPTVGRIAIVIATDHLRGEVDCAEQVQALPGVVDVRVVYHAFDDGPEAPTPLATLAAQLS